MKIGKHVFSLFKTCAFRYQISQNMCFDIRFCTGSGRRRPALQIVKNSYVFVAPAVEYKELTLFKLVSSSHRPWAKVTFK